MEATLDQLLEVYSLMDAMCKKWSSTDYHKDSKEQQREDEEDYEVWSVEYEELREKIVNALKGQEKNTQ